MDMHTHLGYDLSKESFIRAVKETALDEALRSARNGRLTLMAGFTIVRNVGSRGFSDVALMRAFDQDLLPGPRIFPAGQSLGNTGGHCDATGWAPGILELGPEEGVADGIDEVVKAVRYQTKHGTKVIKICATAGVLSYEESVGPSSTLLMSCGPSLRRPPATASRWLPTPTAPPASRLPSRPV